MNNYIHKPDLVYKNQYHIIWCTKYRRPVLTDGIDDRLKEILYEEAAALDVTIHSLEVMPEHVHLFIEFDPRLMEHKIIKTLKGTSSHKLREEFPQLKTRIPCLWTRSYFSCTVGHISEETITRYIKEQKTHQ